MVSGCLLYVGIKISVPDRGCSALCHDRVREVSGIVRRGAAAWSGEGARVARSSWIAVLVAVIVVGAALALVATMWAAIGDAEISAGGWVALVLGVLVALALGFGLMALVFISSRSGYDDPDDHR
jgi:hypothetical protein